MCDFPANEPNKNMLEFVTPQHERNAIATDKMKAIHPHEQIEWERTDVYCPARPTEPAQPNV